MEKSVKYVQSYNKDTRTNYFRPYSSVSIANLSKYLFAGGY